MKITFELRNTNLGNIQLDVDTNDTIKQIKEKLSKKTGTPADNMKIIFSGRLLQNSSTVGDYGLESSTAITVIVNALGDNNQVANIGSRAIQSLPTMIEEELKKPVIPEIDTSSIPKPNAAKSMREQLKKKPPQFPLRPMIEISRTNGSHVIALMGIRPISRYTRFLKFRQKPRSLVLILDFSGSMQREKQAMKNAVCKTINKLYPGDSLTVIAFASKDSSKVICDNVKMVDPKVVKQELLCNDNMSCSPGERAYMAKVAAMKSAKEKAMEKIQGINVSGGTYIEEAFVKCGQTLSEIKKINGEAKVVVLTDGDLNDFHTATQALETLGEQYRNIATIDFIELGDDCNHEQLERIAKVFSEESRVIPVMRENLSTFFVDHVDLPWKCRADITINEKKTKWTKTFKNINVNLDENAQKLACVKLPCDFYDEQDHEPFVFEVECTARYVDVCNGETAEKTVIFDVTKHLHDIKPNGNAMIEGIRLEVDELLQNNEKTKEDKKNELKIILKRLELLPHASKEQSKLIFYVHLCLEGYSRDSKIFTETQTEFSQHSYFTPLNEREFTERQIVQSFVENTELYNQLLPRLPDECKLWLQSIQGERNSDKKDDMPQQKKNDVNGCLVENTEFVTEYVGDMRIIPNEFFDKIPEKFKVKHTNKDGTVKSFQEGLFERNCYCPITEDVMRFPIKVPTGVTYEANALMSWFVYCIDHQKPLACPITGEELWTFDDKKEISEKKLEVQNQDNFLKKFTPNNDVRKLILLTIAGCTPNMSEIKFSDEYSLECNRGILEKSSLVRNNVEFMNAYNAFCNITLTHDGGFTKQQCSIDAIEDAAISARKNNPICSPLVTSIFVSLTSLLVLEKKKWLKSKQGDNDAKGQYLDVYKKLLICTNDLMFTDNQRSEFSLEAAGRIADHLKLPTEEFADAYNKFLKAESNGDGDFTRNQCNLDVIAKTALGIREKNPQSSSVLATKIFLIITDLIASEKKEWLKGEQGDIEAKKRYLDLYKKLIIRANDLKFTKDQYRAFGLKAATIVHSNLNFSKKPPENIAPPPSNKNKTELTKNPHLIFQPLATPKIDLDFVFDERNAKKNINQLINILKGSLIEDAAINKLEEFLKQSFTEEWHFEHFDRAINGSGRTPNMTLKCSHKELKTMWQNLQEVDRNISQILLPSNTKQKSLITSIYGEDNTKDDVQNKSIAWRLATVAHSAMDNFSTKSNCVIS